MSKNYFITNLLNIKDENLSFSEGIYHKVIRGVTYTILTAKLEYSDQVCPHCASNHNLIKYGFKPSKVRFSRAGDHPVLIDLKKQKMFCKSCDKYFLLETKIVDKHCNISNQVKSHIISSLTKKLSMKDIGHDNYVSTTTVARFMAMLDNEFNVDFSYLPENLSFDEFKSTKDAKGAMSFIYLNSDNHRVIDIVENRQLYFLKRYFLCYPRYVRDKVKTVCIDMYSPYISLIKELFVNAEIIIDRFHIVKLFTNSFNHTRIDTMKVYSPSNIKYKRLKKYWKHFLKPYKLLDIKHFFKRVHFPDKLVSDEDIVDISLDVDKTLKNTYDCYQCLREDIEKKDFELFTFHLNFFKDKVSAGMKTSINTCFYYLEYIKNSFTYDYSNGPIEGINNFVKVLKRIAFGYRNFANFRTRIFITRNLLAS